ncbi:CUE domain-containing protein 2 [Dromiciops gliroides]|uniref:CUE domain-containing protein 2 n=1 Tax=Dromiciops gliroides TaxID=33562 RepID=UPI001CC57B77|nr:CUE domain-containing protein 2 [Dromiciops gliroides]XP_043844879.1 CUE domain-containing protein 2 [Dromiciops gliroides]
MELERIIRDTLISFAQTHVPGADLSGLDDVVFSYITGVLEDLGSPGASDESFDMEAFAEMMDAYVPGFAKIPSGTVCDMMFNLSGQLSDARNKENVCPKSQEDTAPTSPESLQSLEEGSQEIRKSQAHTSTPPLGGGTKAEEISETDELQAGIQLLLEMFPSCTVGRAQRALAMARGDLEEAVQIMVEEKVEPQGLGSNSKDTSRLQGAPKKEELKSFILQKYMMVDSEEDQKTHRPVAPKEAPKKLIRYIDNQVVSTKGERYKDIRKPEPEGMKSTYISLKPARKYKFH